MTSTNSLRRRAVNFLKTDVKLDFPKIEVDWDRQWRRRLIFLFCFFCIQAVLVAEVVFPQFDLDSHWEAGLNQAVADGLVFGREIIFSYGPYSNVFTGMYHPENFYTALLGSFYLGCVYMAAMSILTRSRKSGALLAVTLVCVFCFYLSKQSAWLATMFYGALAALRLTSSERQMTAGDAGRIAFIFSSLGLAFLIKTNATLWAVFVSFFTALYFLVKKNHLAAALAVLSPAAMTMALWVMAGQPLPALPDYTLTTLPLVRGYLEAQNTKVDLDRLAAFIAIALAIILAVWRQSRSRPWPDRPAITALFSAYLFLSFKGHFTLYWPQAADLFGRTLIAAALGLWLIFGGRNVLKFVLGLAVVVIPLFATDGIKSGSVLKVPIIHDTLRITQQFEGAVRTWKAFVFDRQSLDEEYERALARLREAHPLPKLPGSSDLYTNGINLLLASGNNWNPRPIIQSYVAYGPELAEINRRHLLNRATAPDNIFFNVASAWGSDLPSVEDGASWPALLALYEPTELRGAYLVLRRRAVEAPVLEPSRKPAFTASLGERIALPETDETLFMRFDLRMNRLGEVFKFLYKPENLYLLMELDNGRTFRRRLVSGRVKSGYLLNRVVATTEQFAALYSREKTRALPRVVAITVQGPTRGQFQNAFWRREFEVYMDTLPPYEIE